MLFSTTIFLFLFLPGVLAVYYNPWIKGRTFRNLFLVFVSILFYAWGEPVAVILMLLSIMVNYKLGLLADRYRNSSKIRLILTGAVCYNLGMLFLFKYLTFTLKQIGLFTGQPMPALDIALPIGISFYTFQALSYVIDVYRQTGKAQKNPLQVGLYIAFFPQLIAGPIVRYETIAEQIEGRKETVSDFYDGVLRFMMGFGKKILLANTLALGADACFSAVYFEELSVLGAWIGSIFYSLQILFDFSGYSDMAIGLGKMFGFHFLENFNYPYTSGSVSEFWRRWHISLGSWFRDYVYIPLGGNRMKTPAGNIRNIFIVWLLTGIWHGANWTFLVWGLLYFVVLTIEKQLGWDKKNTILSHVLTMVIVVIGWTIFRADNLSHAILYLRNMFGLAGHTLVDASALWYIKEYGCYLFCAVLACLPWRDMIGRLTGKRQEVLRNLYPIWAMCVFLLGIVYMIKGTYNPFIYFNF